MINNLEIRFIYNILVIYGRGELFKKHTLKKLLIKMQYAFIH